MTRVAREHPLKTAVLIVSVLVSVAMSAGARHRKASDGEPGTFDYYLLSLSWSPAFCLTDPGAAECNGPRRFGFIVHGLWPQYEKGWPENCNVHQQVPDSVVTGISDIMPARGLVYHEWSAHGTCSGLAPADFFALVRRAYAGIAVPAPLAGVTHEVEQPPSAIAAEFLHANPRLSAQSIVVTCGRQDAPRLREVHICLDRDLNPRACSADAARGACRAATLIVPPIR
ncbi:MAG TPA: ribonuclease T2 [Steroidobacteraceae bacterium]|jgi:ribonuclease T2|nr:ribonuclease T2 [Steroidobacteraceae bacterium]